MDKIIESIGTTRIWVYAVSAIVMMMLLSINFRCSLNDLGMAEDSGVGCELNLGKYQGELWSNPSGETVDRRCLLQTNRLRVDFHTRLIGKNGNSGNDPDAATSITDWLWLDYGSRVNVLVQLKANQKFLVFEQSKYALEGKSLAVVGGFIESGETAQEAAVREVNEELGMECDKFVSLGGKFRTDVNRGLGWVHPYFAIGCVMLPKNQRKASDDQEKQQQQQLSLRQLESMTMAGKFVEVQWSNTVALGLLYIRNTLDQTQS
eukprot:m.178627 g.178627  ORF g.178627 m.178627 type:complete len:263 (-) comp31947_c0_seq3:571-1359(-)